MYYKKFDKAINIGNRNFQKILDFYLFRCPTPHTSARSKTFEQLGWKGVPQFSRLKKKLLEAASASLKSNYHPCKKDELIKAFEIISSATPVEEYCVFLKNDEKTIIQSLFSAIRNALAHGSFSIQTYNKIKVYFFANFDKYLKAEIALQEQTLLSWIAILEDGYEHSA